MGEFWDGHQHTIDRENFRGHHHYLDQPPDFPYRAAWEWIRVNAPPPLRDLEEDGAFGACVTEIDGRKVSRDLVDSILEMTFLGWCGGVSVLDIGAGYGRFVDRFLAAYPLSRAFCVDPVAVSREVCERYLAHRGHGSRATVLSPESVAAHAPYDLAVNVHSWSECSMGEVATWIDQLEQLKVPRLFVVPHHPGLGVYSAQYGGGNGPSYQPLLERAGYELRRLWGGPECYGRSYYLFERKDR